MTVANNLGLDSPMPLFEYGRIWLATKPVPWTYRINGLTLIASQAFEGNVYSDDNWFVFMNKRRSAVRILHYQEDSVLLLEKSFLGESRFPKVSHSPDCGPFMELSSSEIIVMFSPYSQMIPIESLGLGGELERSGNHEPRPVFPLFESGKIVPVLYPSKWNKLIRGLTMFVPCIYKVSPISPEYWFLIMNRKRTAIRILHYQNDYVLLLEKRFTVSSKHFPTIWGQLGKGVIPELSRAELKVVLDASFGSVQLTSLDLSTRTKAALNKQ